MRPSQASEAIVLRARAYGESDKIVTFLTCDAGKLTGIAKGAKNSRRRFANCLDAFTRVRVHFRVRPGASLVFMESCDLLHPPGVLTEPVKFAYGSYLIELVDLLTGEAHPVREIFELLTAGLDELERGPATAALLRAFELQLLIDTGYEPQLTVCSRCRQPLAVSAQAYLDTMTGSLFCAACRSTAQMVIAVAGETLAALDAVKGQPLSTIRDRRFARTIAAEATQLMGHLLAQYLPRPPRSLKLIAALGR